MEEHAVVIHLCVTNGQFGTEGDRKSIFALEHALESAVASASVGEFDGDEFGEGECVLYFYGPDADSLFAVIEPVLKSSPAAFDGFAIKRYGDVSNLEARIIRVTW